MNRGLLLALGAFAVGVLVAAVAVPLVYLGDDDEVAEQEEAVRDAREDAERERAREEDEAIDEEVDELEDDLAELDEELEDQAQEAFEVFTARDPFEQLVVDEPEPIAPDPDDPDPLDPDPLDPDEPDPDDLVDPNDEDPNSVSDDPDGNDDVNVNGTTIGLEEIYDDDGTSTAQVTVNGRGYDVTEGQDFAQTLRLLSIDDPCVDLRYRDRRGEDLRFTLCEGETIRK